MDLNYDSANVHTESAKSHRPAADSKLSPTICELAAILWRPARLAQTMVRRPVGRGVSPRRSRAR